MPLQFWVRGCKGCRGEVGALESSVLAVGAGRGYRGAGELDADGAFAGLWVIGFFAEPDEAADLGGVGVAGGHDVVVDFVVVEGFERAVAVGCVTILLFLVSEFLGITMEHRGVKLNDNSGGWLSQMQCSRLYE